MRFFASGFFLLALLTLNPSRGFSQVNFIDGLIISETGDSLYGKIDFQDWSRNPTSITFIQNGSVNTEVLSPEDIRSFSVGEVYYESREVVLDLAPLEVIDKRTEVLPLSLLRQVFLKSLIRGTTSLFLFKTERPHFYLEEKGQITQLVSNQYVVLSEGKYQLRKEYEYSYREQLSIFNTSCNDNETSKVEYSSASLVDFILKCHLDEKSDEITYVLKSGNVVVETGFLIGFGREFFNHGNEINEQEKLPLEKKSAGSTSFGFKLKFILPKNDQKNSVSVSVDYAQIKIGSDEEYMDFNTFNFRTWYSSKSEIESISPFYDIGISISKKISDEDNEDFEPVYKVRPGYFVGGGIDFGIFYGVLRADLRPRGGFSVDHKTFSLLFGFEF